MLKEAGRSGIELTKAAKDAAEVDEEGDPETVI